MTDNQNSGMAMDKQVPPTDGVLTEAMIDAAIESCVRNTGKSRAWVKQWMPVALGAALQHRKAA